MVFHAVASHVAIVCLAPAKNEGEFAVEEVGFPLSALSASVSAAPGADFRRTTRLSVVRRPVRS